MFRTKNRPWYLKTIAILIVLRIIYGFAGFFLKVAYRQANPKKAGSKRIKSY